MQYPRDFIKNAYEMIQAKGGVCVADEVNVLSLSSVLVGNSECRPVIEIDYCSLVYTT